jgi:hypothetical protein
MMSEQPLEELEDIFREGEELARRKFHATTQKEAQKEEKARRRRHLLRVIILGGFLGVLGFLELARLFESDVFAIVALLCGNAAGISFLCLLLMGGVAEPRGLDKLTKAARRRLKD